MTKTNRQEQLKAHYTIDEIATAYGLHPATVRRWITRFGCPALSTGGTWRLELQSVQQWLRERGHLRAGRKFGGGK